jgi:protein TonB
VVELSGILDTRQTEERQAAPEELPEELPPEPPPPPPEPEIPEPEAVPLVRETPLRPVPRPNPRPRAPSAAQQQRTISRNELEAAVMRRYLSLLTRAVRSRLVYPVEALAKGWTGVATVVFSITESGALAPGSLRVAVSSGQPILDAAALRAVESGAPYDPPPHRTDVRVELKFVRDGG